MPPNASAVVTVLLVIGWYATSMVAITTSKLTMEAARVPLVLCSVQFLSATLLSGAAMALQGTPRRFPGKEFTLLGGVSSTYTLGFFFTNLAFSLANASFVETIKSGEPISTVVLAYVLLNEVERASTYASLVPVVLGVALASSGEAGGTIPATAATIASNFGFSARAVFAKQLQRDHPASPSAKSDVCLFFHLHWMGLLALLPLAVFSEAAPLLRAIGEHGFDMARFVSIILLNGGMYTGYNLFSFMVLSRVTTATHSVLNVCRRVCIISFTSAFFGTPMSPVNMAGILIAVAGFVWFTRAKTGGGRAKSA